MKTGLWIVGGVAGAVAAVTGWWWVRTKTALLTAGQLEAARLAKAAEAARDNAMAAVIQAGERRTGATLSRPQPPKGVPVAPPPPTRPPPAGVMVAPGRPTGPTRPGFSAQDIAARDAARVAAAAANHGQPTLWGTK